MMLSKESDSPIRLIDFGMIIELPLNQNVIITKSAVGTAGYIAPETVTRFQYSHQSDIWQAGCCLYNLLSGHSPFNPDSTFQITELSYYPMKGEGWDNISDSAKKLVDMMLQKNPLNRPSIDTLLSHSWISGSTASQTDLGKRYSLRIKKLSLRKKMRKFFLDNELNQTYQTRKKLQTILPSLSSHLQSSNLISPLDKFEDQQKLPDEISKEKLENFQSLMLNELSNSSTGKLTSNELNKTDNNTNNTINGEVNYETFCKIIKQADLMELAKESVFAIFDSNNTGKLNI